MILPLLLAFLSAFSSLNYVAQRGLSSANLPQEHLIIQRRRIVLMRTAEIAKQFPHRKTAVVSYPVVKTFADPVVLRRIRSLLEFKNIFDYSLEEYRNDSWLSEFNYTVTYNRNYLFDITFTQSGVAAYPDEQTKHFLINLKTGHVIKASDAFAIDKLPALAVLVNENLQAELKLKSEETKKASDLDESEATSIVEGLEQLKFEIEDLNNFSVNAKGVTFLYDVGLPHVFRAFEPEGRYFFSYSELRTYWNQTGPLAPFVP